MRRLTIIALICLMALSSVSIVGAQGGGNFTGTAQQGGSYGGPGMSGATGNSTASRQANSVSFQSPSFEYSAPSFEMPEINVPSSGNSDRPTRGTGGRDFTGIQRDSLDFSSFSANLEQFQLSFNRSFENDSAAWSDFGGFGNLSYSGMGDDGFSGVNRDELSFDDAWSLDDASNLPESPAAYGENMLNATDLADMAQAEMPEFDVENSEWNQTISDTAQATQQSAADAYNQLWDDYYAAVDATAQAYYDTVAASVDYAQQAYIEAVDYTLQAIDYYYDYAAQYAYYCYYYPWDCYSYAYDDASGVYVDVSYVSDEPTAEITIGDVTVIWSDGVVSAPTSSSEAYEALVVFANDQLGMVVQPLYAGQLTEDIQALMVYLPDEVEAYAAALTSADLTYWGIFNGGVGAVAIDDCGGACDTDSLGAELSDDSIGLYALTTGAPMPTSDAEALDLVTTVYPALNGLAFAQVTNTDGYAYLGTATSLGADSSGRSVSVSKLVYTGVVNVEGNTIVYALVTIGQPSTDAFLSLIAN